MKSNHIIQDPQRMSGAPCFVGTRVTVKSMFDYLEAGDSLETFLEQFPTIRREIAVAVLEESQRALLAV